MEPVPKWAAEATFTLAALFAAAWCGFLYWGYADKSRWSGWPQPVGVLLTLYGVRGVLAVLLALTGRPHRLATRAGLLGLLVLTEVVFVAVQLLMLNRIGG